MKSARFESNSRYYNLYIQQDLLDDWVVTCAYGGLNSKRGNIKHYPFLTLDEALVKFNEISKKRISRGYQLIWEKPTGSN